jgi:hypothetical protein
MHTKRHTYFHTDTHIHTEMHSNMHPSIHSQRHRKTDHKVNHHSFSRHAPNIHLFNPNREASSRDATKALESTLRSGSPLAALSPSQFIALCDVLLELVRVFGTDYKNSILSYLPFLLTVSSPSVRSHVSAVAVAAGLRSALMSVCVYVCVCVCVCLPSSLFVRLSFCFLPQSFHLFD